METANNNYLEPTIEINGIKVGPGTPLLNGAYEMSGCVNFSLYTAASYCELLLYHEDENEPFCILPFPEEYRMGKIFAMSVFDIDIDSLEYGFRVDGKFDRAKGDIFDKNKILLDPYAKVVTGRNIWGECPDWRKDYQYRGKVNRNIYNWQGDHLLKIPHENLIIYEVHLRGFTKHASANVEYNGTYRGLQEKISYLKALGINAIELLPIFEFDDQEFYESTRTNQAGDHMCNYWGYSTVAFFAPKAAYAASGKENRQVCELKDMIKELHRNGIAVILDVVFNHTAEGDEVGRYISFKGLDNKTYYLLNPDGSYANYSGCGNTLNCNHPIVRNMILASMRYWTSEYHIDGFRFDLAAILGRDQAGEPMANPPLLEILAFDPLLSESILIAEAWDAAGLYQVGSFPAFGKWREWNGKYRDDIRHFLKGDEGFAEIAARRITGSHDLYDTKLRGYTASINFINCHDGFTLYDLYSYNFKHNDKNGWNNTDGTNDNYSWNCGVEGETTDKEVMGLRYKMIKNAAAVLFCSLGIPMFLAGDEFCNTQYGNNNPYCQDNEISWLNWDLLEKNQEIFKFFQGMIAFRKDNAALRQCAKMPLSGYPPISWHGIVPWKFDHTATNRIVGILYAGNVSGENYDCYTYLIINTHWHSHCVTLPKLPSRYCWRIFVNTAMPTGQDIYTEESNRPLVSDQIIIKQRSVMIFTA